ncbi:MAG TPA: hypothetical protein VGJ14_04890 [Sporichthyaceae bacterium]|jgi:hypothetical protein
MTGALDYDALRARARATWSAGDFAAVGTMLPIVSETRVVMPSVDFWSDFFRTYFGPTIKAFEVVGADGAAALEADLKAFANRNNKSRDGTLVLPQDYVDILIRF